MLRMRDLEERGEIFVGGDEQAMVVRKLAVFGLVAGRVSIGMHLPNLFCEFRQGYATTLLKTVKCFVNGDFLYTARGRTASPESSTYEKTAVIACSHQNTIDGITPARDASKMLAEVSLVNARCD